MNADKNLSWKVSRKLNNSSACLLLGEAMAKLEFSKSRQNVFFIRSIANHHLSLKFRPEIVEVPSRGLHHVALGVVGEAVEVCHGLRLGQLHEGGVDVMGIFVALQIKIEAIEKAKVQYPK